MSKHSPLDPIRRIVTSHNDQSKAVISIDDLVQGEIAPHGSAATLIWSAESSPADVSSKEDKGKLETGLVNNGSVIRVVDFPPHSTGKFHRTISLDFVLVMKGTVSLTLDDGSKTPVSEGGVVVQQATMHGWDNDTDDWARIFVVLTAAKEPVVNGVPLKSHMTFTVK